MIASDNDGENAAVDEDIVVDSDDKDDGGVVANGNAGEVILDQDTETKSGDIDDDESDAFVVASSNDEIVVGSDSE